MEKVFQKLVRDKIPEIIQKNGEVAYTRILEEEEYRSCLFQKLQEESSEVIHAEDASERLEELADVLEVLTSIAELEGGSIEQVQEIAKTKRLKRGGFQKRVFLEKAE